MNTTKSTIVSYTFPEDILSNILQRLPVKKLQSLVVVCKGWYALISSSSFILAQLRSPKNTINYSYIHKQRVAHPPISYIIVNEKLNPRTIRETSDSDDEDEILGTVNGLVLYCDLNDVYSLVNPATKRSSLIPNESFGVQYNFDAAWVFFGLGYDRHNDDYLIMRFVRFWMITGYQSDVKMFSRNHNTWFNINQFPGEHLPWSNACFTGELFHWLVHVGNGLYSITTYNYICNSYGSIKLPHFTFDILYLSMEGLDENNIGFYGSTIHTDINGRRKLYFEMHTLSYNLSAPSWSKIIIVKEDILQENYDLVPINFVDTAHTKIMFRIDPFGFFGSFDINNKQFCQLWDVDRVYGVQHTYKYVESLVSPMSSIDIQL